MMFRAAVRPPFQSLREGPSTVFCVVGVHRGHQAFLDADAFLEQDVDQRGKAVGGAAGVGNDVVLGGVVLVVIDALHEGAVLTLGGSRDDDLLGTGGDVTLGLLRVGEQTGRLDDDIDAEVLPRQTFRAARAHHLDLVAVDHDDVVVLELRRGLLGRNGAVETTLRGVVLEQVGKVVGRHDVADGNDVEGGAEVALLDEGAEDKAPDAAESIDGDVGHVVWNDGGGDNERRTAHPPGGRRLCMCGQGRQPRETPGRQIRGFCQNRVMPGQPRGRGPRPIAR